MTSVLCTIVCRSRLEQCENSGTSARCAIRSDCRAIATPSAAAGQRSVHAVELLDELAVNATAATTVQVVDGWLLRAATEFPFRRTNSVFSNRGTGAVDDARFALVANFYRS